MCQHYVLAISITRPLLFLCFAVLDKIHFNPRSALCPIGGPYQNRGACPHINQRFLKRFLLVLAQRARSSFVKYECQLSFFNCIFMNVVTGLVIRLGREFD